MERSGRNDPVAETRAELPASWQTLNTSFAAVQNISRGGLAVQFVSSLDSLHALRNNLTHAVWLADFDDAVGQTAFANFGVGKSAAVFAWCEVEPVFSAYRQDFADLTPRERAKAIRLAFKAWLERLLRLVRRAIGKIKREIARNQFPACFAVVQRQWHIHHGAHPPDVSDIGSVSSTKRPGACLA